MNLKISVLAAAVFATATFSNASDVKLAREYADRTLPPIKAVIQIHGDPQEVWDVIVDHANYSAWNRWVVRIDGEAAVGNTVRAYNDSGKSLLLKITTMEEPHKICWTDVSWFTKFGVGGWRCRTIEVLPNNTGVNFVNHFQYTGVFARGLEAMTRNVLEEGMKLENESLKAFIELRISQ